MSSIDIEQLLAPIGGGTACGENVEYTSTEFGEMVRLAQFKPEQEYGNTLISAEEPDWKALKKVALLVLGQSKDIRAAAYLTMSLLRTDGLPGMADGLHLARGFIEQYWDGVHPQLDAEDNDDPTERMNALMMLCDPDGMLRGVREAPLVSAKGVGEFSLRDYELAEAGGKVNAPDMSLIIGTFNAADRDELTQMIESVSRAAADVQAIEALLIEKVSSDAVIDLDELGRRLRSIAHVYKQHAPQPAKEDETPDETDTSGEAVRTASSTSSQSMSGSINSRDDVVKAIDRICRYFRKNEPSSPVPLLLRRAQRMVHMDFMAILRDVAPEGLAQVEQIVGQGADQVEESQDYSEPDADGD